MTPGNSTGEAVGDQYYSIEGLTGSNFDDTLRMDLFVNSVWALEGDDTIDGRGANDDLHGQSGNDILIGGAGDTLLGGDGDDVLIGGPGLDVLDGGPGDDIEIQ